MKAEASGQPVGPFVDATPAPMPGAAVLKGRFGHIEKLDPRMASGLWAVLKDRGELWTYMFYGPFSDERAFSNFVTEIAALNDPYYYAIFDQAGKARGWASLMRMQPAARVIEVGSIVYAPALQRTPLATEVQYLLAHYVFETLGYRRYEWKCDNDNGPSKRAAERFGFKFEGIFRQDRVVKGKNRDTAWFSIVDKEWPALAKAYEGWLDPDNFDREGMQKRRLEDFRK